MQLTANRPAMRSGASSVAFNKKPDLQTFQTEQTSENVTKSDNSAQQTSKQLQAQLLNIGLNRDERFLQFLKNSDQLLQ